MAGRGLAPTNIAPTKSEDDSIPGTEDYELKCTKKTKLTLTLPWSLIMFAKSMIELFFT